MTADDTDKPVYKHDCKGCVFIRSEGGGPTNRVEIYVHYNPSGRHTTIRRFSSIPSDYHARTGDIIEEEVKP